MEALTRITRDPAVMGRKPCIRDLRVTVGTVVGLVASGATAPPTFYAPIPILKDADFTAALTYGAWRAEEVDIPLAAASRSCSST